MNKKVYTFLILSLEPVLSNALLNVDIFILKTGLLFDIYEGQITAILGHSGAGKSSLLNILSGLSVPTEGEQKTNKQKNRTKRKNHFSKAKCLIIE